MITERWRSSAKLGLALLALASMSRPSEAAPARASGTPWCATGEKHAAAAIAAHREAVGRGLRLATVERASADVGQIAVLQDEGDLALLRNPLNLQGAAVRFSPAGGGYSATRMSLPFEPDSGTPVTLGDDDSRPASLPFGFRFYGQSYTSMFINSDGNLTFGAPDSASTSRDVGRLVSGPARIAPLLADLNLESGGKLSMLATSDHATVSWREVPQFGMADKNTFQVTLWADGRIDFVYGSDVNSALEEGAVGIAPGAGQGGLTAVDFSTAVAATGSGALVEGFRSQDALDTVAVARKFYRSHPDDYQQLVVYTSRSLVPGDTFSYEQTVKNQDAGIGAAISDDSGAYGSAGRLESFVDMDAISKYPDDLNQRFLGEDSALSVLAHEVGHRWLAQALFMDGGRASHELLGRDDVHWSFFFDSDGSYLEGNDIADLGAGQFRTAGASLRYSALDQYLMGLRPAAEVPSFFFVRNPAGPSNLDPGREPRTGVSLSGTRKDVAINDVIAAIGPRNPSPAPAPRPFRQAFVYVVVGGGAPDATSLARLEKIMVAWPGFFTQSTDGRGSVDPRLN